MKLTDERIWVIRGENENPIDFARAIESELAQASEPVGYTIHSRGIPVAERDVVGHEIVSREEAEEYMPECLTAVFTTPQPAAPVSYMGFLPTYEELQAKCAELDESAKEDEYVRERMATLLSETAVALKGPEAALHRHGWQDLPQEVLKLQVELQQARHDLMVRETAKDDRCEELHTKYLSEHGCLILSDAAVTELQARCELLDHKAKCLDMERNFQEKEIDRLKAMCAEQAIEGYKADQTELLGQQCSDKLLLDEKNSQIENLSAFINRLCRQVNKFDPGNKVTVAAAQYMHDKNLLGTSLRKDDEGIAMLLAKLKNRGGA